MRRRAGIKPSRSASAFAVFVGIGLACFGVFMLSQITGRPRSTGFPDFPGFSDFPGAPGPSSAPGESAGTAFLIFWLVCVVGVIIFHLLNALSEDAPPMEVIDYDSPPNSFPGSSQPSVANQLRELEQLKNENLISQVEYEQKRNEIIRRL